MSYFLQNDAIFAVLRVTGTIAAFGSIKSFPFSLLYEACMCGNCKSNISCAVEKETKI